MFIILHPDDLKKGKIFDKKNPTLHDFDTAQVTGLRPNDVVLYRYDNETIVLKGPDGN